MRILLTHRPGGAYGYISDGWLHALQDRGHTVQRWDGQPQSWIEFQPELYIGCSGHKQPIPESRNCKVALHVNPWGPVSIQGINEPEESKQWALQQRPDCVFGYGHEEDRLLWSYWTERAGIKWAPMPTAGDRVIYQQHHQTRDLQLAYVGGYWPYKGKSLQQYLLPVLRHPQIKAQVHGWGEWPREYWYGGTIADPQVAELYGSAQIVPCVSEPHTLQYGFDLPERVFKAALCGALPIHDAVPALSRFCPDLPVARDQQHYLELCLHYSRPQHQQERLELADRVRQQVLRAHTYHHRMATLLDALGFSAAANQMV